MLAFKECKAGTVLRRQLEADYYKLVQDAGQLIRRGQSAT